MGRNQPFLSDSHRNNLPKNLFKKTVDFDGSFCMKAETNKNKLIIHLTKVLFYLKLAEVNSIMFAYYPEKKVYSTIVCFKCT